MVFIFLFHIEWVHNSILSLNHGIKQFVVYSFFLITLCVIVELWIQALIFEINRSYPCYHNYICNYVMFLKWISTVPYIEGLKHPKIRSLIDVNECLLLPNPCKHGTCNNTNGTYVCTCEPGWTGQLCDTGRTELYSVLFIARKKRFKKAISLLTRWSHKVRIIPSHLFHMTHLK